MPRASKLGALPLAEGEGVRSTLLQGTGISENHDLVHVKVHENHEFDKTIKNLKNLPNALRNFQGPSNMSLVTPRHALDV